MLDVKLCSRCGVEKPRSEFYAKKTRKDGLRSECKECSKAEAKTWNDANKDKVKAKSAHAYSNNRDRRIAQMREWKQANKEHVSEYNKANCAAFREQNPEYMREYLKRYKVEINPAAVARARVNHRVAKRKQCPIWANEFFISEAYHLAALRTQMTGIKWEVDHIVPLVNPLVSGLHTEHNLRVIPASENRKKGNRFWPDMP